MTCSPCKGPFQEVRRDHDVGALLGLKSVMVKSMKVLECEQCKGITVIGAELEKAEARLVWAITTRMNGRGFSDEVAYPDEMKFLRKSVGDTQEEFAVRMGTTLTTVKRWEEEFDEEGTEFGSTWILDRVVEK